MKNGLPRIAARTKMINRVLELYPQRPRHAVALPIQFSNVKCLDLTLFPTPLFPTAIQTFASSPTLGEIRAIACPQRHSQSS
jgi:hypothetical protein